MGARRGDSVSWPTADDYAEARPFPHAVIDGFISPEWAEQIAAEFPPLNTVTIPELDGVWHHFSSSVEEKWQCSDWSAFGPQTRRLWNWLKLHDLRRKLGAMVGTDRLRASVFGGGYHLIRPGGFLGMHTDSLHDPDGEHWETSWYRCVNLLVFLTDNEDNASAYLRLQHQEFSDWHYIAPKPGRAVIFTTTGETLHGHPVPFDISKPTDGPAGYAPKAQDRRSFACYYYRESPPPWWSEERDTKPTTFVSAP